MNAFCYASIKKCKYIFLGFINKKKEIGKEKERERERNNTVYLNLNQINHI
jgi:hypothetical protein